MVNPVVARSLQRNPLRPLTTPHALPPLLVAKDTHLRSFDMAPPSAPPAVLVAPLPPQVSHAPQGSVPPNRQNPRCTYCYILGHQRDEYPKLQRVHQNMQKRTSTTSVPPVAQQVSQQLAQQVSQQLMQLAHQHMQKRTSTTSVPSATQQLAQQVSQQLMQLARPNMQKRISTISISPATQQLAQQVSQQVMQLAQQLSLIQVVYSASDPSSCHLDASAPAVSKRFVWAYASFQFAIVVLFAHIFYTLLKIVVVFSILLSSFTGFGIAIGANTLFVEFLRWRTRRSNRYARHQANGSQQQPSENSENSENSIEAGQDEGTQQQEAVR